MERKIDYIIRENKEERLIFRFYPRRSHCHSSGNKPPKTWKGVYKVYYSYSIIRQYIYEGKVEETVIKYSDYDECSIIMDVGYSLRDYISKGIYEIEFELPTGEKYTSKLLEEYYNPIGMGTSWLIHKCKDDYIFYLFSWDNVGYRFSISNEYIEEFGQYLIECCEYMLEHGEGI